MSRKLVEMIEALPHLDQDPKINGTYVVANPQYPRELRCGSCEYRTKEGVFYQIRNEQLGLSVHVSDLMIHAMSEHSKTTDHSSKTPVMNGDWGATQVRNLPIPYETLQRILDAPSAN